jgi:hypothetical protein
MAAFVIEAWAFIDALTRPQEAFPAAGKLTKALWLIILGVGFAIGLYTAIYGGVIGMLSVAAFVASSVYLADVRPKIKEYRKGTRSGPYGPW